MMRHLFFSAAYLPILAACCIVGLALSPTSLQAQNVTADSVTFNTGPYVVIPFGAGGGFPGGLDIDTPAGNGVMTINDNAEGGLFTLSGGGPGAAGQGIGLGFDGFNEFPTAPVHLVGGGGFGASTFPFANLFIEDRNPIDPGNVVKETLSMRANAGVGMSMDDRASDTTFWIDNFDEFLDVSSSVGGIGNPIFSVDSFASLNSLNLAEVGVGIGTKNPISTLHVLADDGLSNSFGNATITTEARGGTAQTRVMLNSINNGGSIFSMTDTSLSGNPQWLITNINDTLSLRKAGANASNMTIFGDGNIRFTFNQVPNATIQPNGNLFVRGAINSNGPVNGMSDRNVKENIKTVDTNEILAKVVKLPITTWNYIYDESDTPHMGPMAQDFFASFGLGEDDKRIAYMDKDGVALAAIQGLNTKVEAKDKEIAELTQTLKDQTELILELTERLDRLESLVAPNNK
jgi:hypothetical protein